jgi:hypothetical protein
LTSNSRCTSKSSRTNITSTAFRTCGTRRTTYYFTYTRFTIALITKHMNYITTWVGYLITTRIRNTTTTIMRWMWIYW